MSILGYYDSSGNRINHAVDANGALKDVVDGVHHANLRPAVVLYVSFCYGHGYGTLTQPGIPQVHSKLVWYIPLPMQQFASTDDAGVVFS